MNLRLIFFYNLLFWAILSYSSSDETGLTLSRTLDKVYLDAYLKFYMDENGMMIREKISPAECDKTLKN